MRTSYKPGIGVLLTSSICGRPGRRLTRFSRITASCARQTEASVAVRATAIVARRNVFMKNLSSSRVERSRGQPALERGEPVHQTQPAVAKFPQRGRFVRKQV